MGHRCVALLLEPQRGRIKVKLDWVCSMGHGTGNGHGSADMHGALSGNVHGARAGR